MKALKQLAAEVQSEGDLLAAMLNGEGRGKGVFDVLTTKGPRSAECPGEYALILESVLEGYLMHYAKPRIFRPPNKDMRLLGGDFLYALCLTRLARLEDLPAISELSDLIALCAQAELRGPFRKYGDVLPSESRAGRGRREAAYPIRFLRRKAASRAAHSFPEGCFGPTEDKGQRRFAAGNTLLYLRRGPLRFARSSLISELWHAIVLAVVCGAAEAQADLDSAKKAARIGAGGADRDLAAVAGRLSERHGLEQADENFHRELIGVLLV